MEPKDFCREGKALDRGPTGDHAKLRRVKGRVAGVGHAQAGVAEAERGAVDALRGSQVTHGAVVSDPSIRTEQTRRPVGIPVVVEGATDTPGLGQLQLAVAA